MQDAHATTEALDAFCNGQTPEWQARELLAHVQLCRTCLWKLRRTPLRPLAADLPNSESGPTLFRRLRVLVARSGGPAPRHNQTPLEFAAKAVSFLQSRSAANDSDLPGAIADLLYRERYAGQPVRPDEVAALARRLDEMAMRLDGRQRALVYPTASAALATQRLDRLANWMCWACLSLAVAALAILAAVDFVSPPALHWLACCFGMTEPNRDSPDQAVPVQSADTGPLEHEITNSLGMTLVRIPLGRFLMGAPAADASQYEGEGPQHEVLISRPFYIGIHTVTVGQFRRFVEAAGFKTDSEKDGAGGLGYEAATKAIEGRSARFGWRETGWPQTEAHPVVNVSWHDALAFCGWLSQRETRRYELPTEAEWEYACRAGTNTRYWCGDDDASLQGVANLADDSLRRVLSARHIKLYRDNNWDLSAWDDGHPWTATVGSFRANPWGLYDMHGNVWQWCADRLDRDYYRDARYRDPRGPEEGQQHVFRGGSWRSFPRNCRAASRNGAPARDRTCHTGFRVVLRLELSP